MMNHTIQDLSPELRSLYQAAFDNSNEGITIFSQDGKIVLANKIIGENLGTRPEQLTGKTLFDFFPKQVAEAYYEEVHGVFSSGVESAAELTIEINGRTRWIQNHLKPFCDGQGNVQFVFSHSIDITEHKQIIELLNKSAVNLQILLENSNDLILISDKNRRIILYNDAVANYARDSQNKEITPGMKLDDISANEKEDELWKQLHQRVLNGETFREEIILKFPEEERYYETSFQPFFQDDEIVGFSEFTRDITERKLAELALAESEERFRQLAENINEVFWISTPDWNKILYISPAYKEVWGRSRESLYQDASSWVANVIEEDQPKLRAELNVKIAGDLSTPNFPEYRIQHPDGTIRWISARSFPIYNDEGDLIRIAGIAEDITERKRIETAIRKSEARYRNLFTTMFNGFALYKVISNDKGTPVDFRILEVNQAFEKMTGLKAEDIVGKTLLEITPDAEPHWREMFVRVCTTGEPAQLQEYSKDFNKYFNLYAYRPEPGQFAILFADVTKQVLAEKELQKFNVELEQRVKERTDQLERQNKDMESFSYSVSHDLRAPLRAISGFGQILLDEYATRWEEEPIQLLERMIQAGQKMDALIDGLLVLSRLSQAGLNIESINLTNLARQAFELLSSNVKGREINFTAHDTPNVSGDSRLMEAVLTNLISNAIKFTNPQKTAEIEFGHIRQKKRDVFYLKDNGIGFNMEYTDKLFAPFQRFDTGSEVEGTGIGLTIVQQIIERHQGNVWAESRIGEGTTFYFHL
jgi:PAS domain S-box-containing protein